MPTYDYACSACGNQWEEIQKITEPPIEVCPKCNAKKAQRQISGGNFILKGGGWYADLYSSTKPGASKKDDGGGDKSASSSNGDSSGDKSGAKAGADKSASSGTSSAGETGTKKA
jgi:putative FmdB family regulatory protein